jgi:threonyl-tRNA synthetase
VQLDFNLPERFGLEYTGPDNTPHRPIMLHRVLVGSMERFVGGLIEHFAGAFPLWLAPEQVRVIPIADELKGFAQSVVERLKARGVRVHLDDRSDTLNYRIREGEMMKIPYMAVVGKREAESDSIALRVRGAGKKQEIMTVADFTARLEDELATRALKP